MLFELGYVNIEIHKDENGFGIKGRINPLGACAGIVDIKFIIENEEGRSKFLDNNLERFFSLNDGFLCVNFFLKLISDKKSST